MNFRKRVAVAGVPKWLQSNGLMVLGSGFNLVGSSVLVSLMGMTDTTLAIRSAICNWPVVNSDTTSSIRGVRMYAKSMRYRFIIAQNPVSIAGYQSFAGFRVIVFSPKSKNVNVPLGVYQGTGNYGAFATTYGAPVTFQDFLSPNFFQFFNLHYDKKKLVAAPVIDQLAATQTTTSANSIREAYLEFEWKIRLN